MDATLVLPPELLRPIFRLVEDDSSTAVFDKNHLERTYLLRSALQASSLVCSRWHHIIEDDPHSFIAPVVLDFEETNLGSAGSTQEAIRILFLNWAERLSSTQIFNKGIILSIYFITPGLTSEYLNEETGELFAALISPYASRLQALNLSGTKFYSSPQLFNSFLGGMSNANFPNVHTLRISGIDYTSHPLLFPNLQRLDMMASSLCPRMPCPYVEEVKLAYQINTLCHIVDTFLKCPSLRSLCVEGGTNESWPDLPSRLKAPDTLNCLSLAVDFEIFHSLLFPVHFPGLESLQVTGHPILPERVLHPYMHSLETVHFPSLTEISLSNCWPQTVMDLLSCNLSALGSLSIDMSGIWGYYHSPDKWRFSIDKILAPNLKSLELVDIPFCFIIPMLRLLPLHDLISLAIKHDRHRNLLRHSGNISEVAVPMFLTSLTSLNLDIPSFLLASLFGCFPRELKNLAYLRIRTESLPPSGKDPIRFPALVEIDLPGAEMRGAFHSLCLQSWIQPPDLLDLL